MCGIVGILGREPVAVQLVDALKRLEYRGYDSAGVATLEGGRLTCRRAEGKLRNLETRLKECLPFVLKVNRNQIVPFNLINESSLGLLPNTMAVKGYGPKAEGLHLLNTFALLLIVTSFDVFQLLANLGDRHA